MTDMIARTISREQKAWVSSTTDFAVIIDGKTGKQVADFDSPHVNQEESLSNRRLGMAAPRLLGALTRLLAVTELNLDDMESGTVEAIANARAAMAEATGDSSGRAS